MKLIEYNIIEQLSDFHYAKKFTLQNLYKEMKIQNQALRKKITLMIVELAKYNKI
jgi:hypothetical protein